MNNHKSFFYNSPYQGQKDYLQLTKIWLSPIFKINDRYVDIINMQVFKIPELDIFYLCQETGFFKNVKLT